MTEREHNPYAAPSLDDDEEAPESRDDADEHHRLATPLQRLGGRLVDSLVLTGALVLSALMDDRYIGHAVEIAMSPSLWGAFAPLFIPSALVFVAQWLLIGLTGQSIGKRVVGTRIVRLRGSHPGFVYGVLLRSWVPYALTWFATFLLTFAGSLLSLLDALFVFRADRRTLRDHIAATKVIQVRR